MDARRREQERLDHALQSATIRGQLPYGPAKQYENEFVHGSQFQRG
jgi:hypothetical protein